MFKVILGFKQCTNNIIHTTRMPQQLQNFIGVVETFMSTCELGKKFSSHDFYVPWYFVRLHIIWKNSYKQVHAVAKTRSSFCVLLLIMQWNSKLIELRWRNNEINLTNIFEFNIYIRNSIEIMFDSILSAFVCNLIWCCMSQRALSE